MEAQAGHLALRRAASVARGLETPQVGKAHRSRSVLPRLRLIVLVAVYTATVAGATCGAFAEDEVPSLVDQAREAFPAPALSEPEVGFLTNAERGERAVFTCTAQPPHDRPEISCGCDSQRTIRSAVVGWLLRSAAARKLLSDRGVRIEGAILEGELDLEDSQSGLPLELERCSLERGFRASFATVSRLRLSGSFVSDFQAEGIRVSGSVELNEDFRCPGGVCMKGATIGSDLDLSTADLGDSRGRALDLDRAAIGGGLFLRGACDDAVAKTFVASGETYLVSLAVGQDVVVEGARFSARDRKAITADRMSVKGNLRFTPLEVKGRRLAAFRVDGDVRLPLATVGGTFEWWGRDTSAATSLNLSFASMKVLDDEKASWPAPGGLRLHGLVYEGFGPFAERGARERIEWLRIQQNNGVPFSTQPFEQCARTFSVSGDSESAKAVLAAKAHDWAGSPMASLSWRVLYALLGVVMDYGYAPLRAIVWIVGWIAVACWFCRRGRALGVFVASKASEARELGEKYPTFSVLGYVLDTCLPVRLVGVAEYWRPGSSEGTFVPRLERWGVRWGRVAVVAVAVHTAVGWLLSSLAVAGIAGLIKG